MTLWPYQTHWSWMNRETNTDPSMCWGDGWCSKSGGGGNSIMSAEEFRWGYAQSSYWIDAAREFEFPFRARGK